MDCVGTRPGQCRPQHSSRIRLAQATRWHGVRYPPQQRGEPASDRRYWTPVVIRDLRRSRCSNTPTTASRQVRDACQCEAGLSNYGRPPIRRHRTPVSHDPRLGGGCIPDAGSGSDNDSSVQRVSVIASAGSGKSTMGRLLATKLDVPFVELDAIFHQPQWAELPIQEFRRRVAEITAFDAWVIDGNYSGVRDLVWQRAEVIAWLDLPRRTLMSRVVRRTIRRALTRERLWNGNTEPLTNSVGTSKEHHSMDLGDVSRIPGAVLQRRGGLRERTP